MEEQKLLNKKLAENARKAAEIVKSWDKWKCVGLEYLTISDTAKNNWKRLDNF